MDTNLILISKQEQVLYEYNMILMKWNNGPLKQGKKY